MWVWVATDRATRKIIAFKIGGRDSGTLKTMIYQWKFKAKTYYTDYYNAYGDVLPKKSHVTGKAHTYTAESKNFQLRHWLSCLTRRTCCYPKSYRTLNASITLAMHKINNSLNPDYLTNKYLLS